MFKAPEFQFPPIGVLVKQISRLDAEKSSGELKGYDQINDYSARIRNTEEHWLNPSSSDYDAIEQKLAANKSELKRLISSYSNFFNAVKRIDLFSQVDRLLDINRWTEDSSFIEIKSFQEFLFFYTLINTRRPSLGVNSSYTVVASWSGTDWWMDAEFFTDLSIKFICKTKIENEPVYLAWSCQRFQALEMITNLKLIEILDDVKNDS